MRAARISALAFANTGTLVPSTFGMENTEAWLLGFDFVLDQPELKPVLIVVRLPRRIAREYRHGKWACAPRRLAHAVLVQHRKDV